MGEDENGPIHFGIQIQLKLASKTQTYKVFSGLIWQMFVCRYISIIYFS